MSSTLAKLFVSRLREEFEAWHNEEIDLVTLHERQRMTWVTIYMMGPDVEQAVVRALSGRAALETGQLTSRGGGQETLGGLLGAPDYRAQIDHTVEGNPSLKVFAVSPQSGAAEARHIAAYLHELAADMERLSQVLGAHWSIVVEPSNDRIVVELAGDHEADRSITLLTEILLLHHLD